MESLHLRRQLKKRVLLPIVPAAQLLIAILPLGNLHEGLDTDEEPGIEELLSEDEKENLAKNNSMPDVGFVFKFELINCEVLLRYVSAQTRKVADLVF